MYGNRVEQSIDSDGDGSGAAVVTKFAIDEVGNAWADLTSSGSLTTRRLFNGLDQLVARIGSSSNEDWYLTDRLGSVRDLINSSGTLIDHIDYTAFGKKSTETQPSNGDRYGFTGQEHDKEIGLLYYFRRNTDPETFRFLQTDPIGFNAGDANLYRYVGNSPTNATDPNGEFLHILGGAGIGGLINTGIYLGSSYLRGEPITAGGLAGSFVSGAIVGGTISASGGLAALGTAGQAVTGFVAGTVGSVTQQAIDNGNINFGDALVAGVSGAAGMVGAGRVSALVSGRTGIIVSGFVGGAISGTICGAVTGGFEGAFHGAIRGSLEGLAGGLLAASIPSRWYVRPVPQEGIFPVLPGEEVIPGPNGNVIVGGAPGGGLLGPGRRLVQVNLANGRTIEVIIGGGGTIARFNPEQLNSIQQFCNENGCTVIVVGSRASGNINAVSDFDYIISPLNSTIRTRAMRILPRGRRVEREHGQQNGIDILRGAELDVNLPHVIFAPEP